MFHPYIISILEGEDESEDEKKEGLTGILADCLDNQVKMRFSVNAREFTCIELQSSYIQVLLQMAENVVPSTIWLEDRSTKVQESMETLQPKERGWYPVSDECL